MHVNMGFNGDTEMCTLPTFLINSVTKNEHRAQRCAHTAHPKAQGRGEAAQLVTFIVVSKHIVGNSRDGKSSLQQCAER